MTQGIFKHNKSTVQSLDQKHYLHPTSNPKHQAENGPSHVFVKGEGIYVDDISGDRYVDGMSMLWNVNIGHGNKSLAEVSQAQMEALAYSSSFKGFSNLPAIHLAEKLAEIAPGDLNTVFYTSGGSESNDTAFKLSRFYWELQGKPKKQKIIALKRAYHGVTIGAQTATHLTAFNKFSGSNMDGGVLHAEPYLTECERGDRQAENYEESVRGIIEREGADTIAAVIMEPVQGAGGVHVPPEGYLEAIREVCDEHNVHFIADEVITGFARTGKMFGVENWNVVPDFMSIAKGLSSGYAQLGGVMMRSYIQSTFAEHDGVLAHGFTYSGHPTACAVALKNIEIIEEQQLADNADRMGKILANGLQHLQNKYKTLGITRGVGLLHAMEFFQDPEAGIPFPEDIPAAERVYQEALDRKLILRVSAGNGINIVPIAPPLIMNKQQVEDMIAVIDDSIGAFEKSL